MKFPTVLLTYSSGNNFGNLHFIWRVETGDKEKEFTASQYVIETVKQSLPQYHTRAMRRYAYEKFGRVISNTSLAILRHFYRDLTGDSSASFTNQEEIDARVYQFIDMEDTSVTIDLREHNTGQKSKYDIFWDACETFLREDVGVAVDDRRHTDVTHIAKAVSIRDLRDQVQAKCPPGTPVPSCEWIRLQFWPKSRSDSASMQHTGRFKLKKKYMVQRRQFRKQHVDAHYAAAVFRYLREYAVQFREVSTVVCLDDKHRCKVGEPSFPVAAAERGRKVLVSLTQSFEVGDHDFTRFNIIPSVLLKVDIPDEVSGSWYRGQVHIGLKEAAFEASSPLRHATELYSVLKHEQEGRPILFLYTDGGPDHRLTYLSVQLSLVALFRNLDLDFLCAARTAPYHSWRNPVERIMSILNMGLQSVGLMRTVCSSDIEGELTKCNSLTDIRKVAGTVPQLRSAVLDSVSPVKVLLTNVFQRLELKEKKFSIFTSATPEDIDTFWSAVLEIDESLGLPSDKVNQSTLARSNRLQEFFSHCCRQRHYSFSIRKCGEEGCSICSPIRLPRDVFERLHGLPDLIPGTDGHYRQFSEVLVLLRVKNFVHLCKRNPRKFKSYRLLLAYSTQRMYRWYCSVKSVNAGVYCTRSVSLHR